jgi:hypothetical protein
MNFKNPTSRSTLSNNINNYPKAMPLIHEKITVYTFQAYITAAIEMSSSLTLTYSITNNHIFVLHVLYYKTKLIQ